jgi:hypothetical protein
MEHRDKLAWMIEQEGWALEPVMPKPGADPPVPGYSYSIGLESSFGFPDVCVFGLTPVAARGLIGLVVEVVRSGGHVPVGPQFTGLLDNDLRCALLPVDVEDNLDLFESAAGWYGGITFRMVQLMWPDRNGWLPWEPGFEKRLLYASEYKRRQAAPGVKIGGKAFGRDRRYPLVNGFRDHVSK